MEQIYLTDEDHDMVVLVGCSLDRSPGKNWVEKSGGLPEYVCRIARAIHRSGRPISQSIAIAVSRIKKWAAGLDDVDADTRAKAAKALAEWEALKVKNKVKKGVKKVAKAARGKGRDGDKADMSTVGSDLDLVMLAASRQEPRSDLDTLMLAAGKPNPFAKGGDKGGDSGKKFPPFGNKPGGKGGGDKGGSDKGAGGGLNTAAAVKAAWARLQANKNLDPEAKAAQAAKIKAAAKKLNVELS